MRRATTRRLLMAPVLAAAMAAAGCGGSSSDGGSGGGETVGASEWASSLCSDITTWTGALQSSAQPLQGGNLSKDSLQTAAGDMKSATKTFADEVKALGAPDAEAGSEAKKSLDTLAENLNADVEQIDKTVDDVSGGSGVVAAASAVSGTIAKMGSQVTATFAVLQKLDAKGELTDAFKNSTACKSLSGSPS
jgi:hypothetical protein